MKKSVVYICLMMMMSSLGHAQKWNTDLAVARQQAAAENKNIFLVFSGSDWCVPCMNLEKEVWPTEEFLNVAKEKWVLLRADFLQKKGNPEPVDVNEMKMILTEKYNRDGFFPFFVVLDKNGKVVSKKGYEELETAQEYVALFKNMDR